MSKTKKLLIALMLLIAVLLIPNMVNAATIQATETTTTSTGKTVTWSYELDSNNNILDLKCTNISSISGELTIPSTIDGYTVVTIGNTKNGYDDGAFENCPGITGITIPNTVTTIGYRAFYNCTGLKTLTLPNSVNSLGEGAFYGCTGLTSITFSDNLTSIGSYAFENCTGLKSISLPNSLTTIGSGAFKNCTGFAEIVIPDNVTTIEGSAFYGCAGLKNITLSKNITKINNMTFKNCSGLTSVIIPESVTTIEGGYNWQGAFGECTNLEKILIPDSVATIGENAFVDCNKLTIYGNDGQISKSYAEQYSINFKYISQWDESDVGDDITPPYVESILVPYSSVSSYYDSNSTTYIVPSGKVLIINVNFNENILATEVPSLTIRFGSGSNIVLTEGTVSGSTVAYTYTIASGDIGTMAVVSLDGGNVTDEAGNEATLSCPELKVQYWNHYIYANGTAIDVEDGNNNNNVVDTTTYVSFPFIIYNGKGSVDLKSGVDVENYTMYYQFVEISDEVYNQITDLQDKYKNGEITYEEYFTQYNAVITKYNDNNWVETKDGSFERDLNEFTGTKKFALWVKLVMDDKTVYESQIYTMDGSGTATNELDATQKPTTTDKDTTTAKDKLPNTGRVLLFWIIGIVAVSGIVAHIRYKKLYM